MGWDRMNLRRRGGDVIRGVLNEQSLLSSALVLQRTYLFELFYCIIFLSTHGSQSNSCSTSSGDCCRIYEDVSWR